MTSLTGCSLDVLSQIFSYLPASSLACLANTSKPVYHVLIYGVPIAGWYEDLGRCQWPSPLAYKFRRLHKVSLTVDHPRLPDLERLGANHSLAFNARLQVLEIRGRGAFLPFLVKHNLSAPNPNEYWANLGKILPYLTSLSIAEEGMLPRELLDLPGTLPRSLASLEVEATNSIFRKFKLGHLGEMPSLTHLRVHPLAKEDSNLKIPLAKLVSLISLSVPDLADESEIPNGLIRLDAGQLNAERLQRLVECLELRASFIPLIFLDVSLFPPRLTKLTVGTFSYEAIAKVLPPTIRTLRIESTVAQPWKLSFLPDCLTCLDLAQTHFGHPQISFTYIRELAKLKLIPSLRWLPTHLEQLIIRSTDVVYEGWWGEIPPSLTDGYLHLTLYSLDSDGQGDTDLRSHFPRFTGTLDFLTDKPKEPIRSDWIFPLGIRHITFELPFCTPAPNKAPCEALMSIPRENWPSNLSSMTMAWPKFPPRLPDFQSALPSLSQLTLVDRETYAHPLGMAPHLPLREATPGFIESLLNLPGGLTRLCIETKMRFTDPSAVLNGLPRTLTHFECRRLLNFDDKVVHLLPPKLEVLNLHHARTLSDRGVARLPRSLKILQLRLNRAITIQALSVCPPYLSILDIPKNKNFQHCIRGLVYRIMAERGLILELLTLKLWVGW